MQAARLCCNVDSFRDFTPLCLSLPRCANDKIMGGEGVALQWTASHLGKVVILILMVASCYRNLHGPSVGQFPLNIRGNITNTKPVRYVLC